MVSPELSTELSNKYKDAIRTAKEIQKGRKDWWKLLRWGLSLRFGDDSLSMMPEIQKIHDSKHLKAIKDAIRTAKDVSELKSIIEIQTADHCVPGQD